MSRKEEKEPEEGDYDLTGYGKGLSIVLIDDFLPSHPLGSNIVSVHNGCKSVPRKDDILSLDRIKYRVSCVEYTFKKNETFDLVTSGAQMVYVHISRLEFQ